MITTMFGRGSPIEFVGPDDADVPVPPEVAGSVLPGLAETAGPTAEPDAAGTWLTAEPVATTSTNPASNATTAAGAARRMLDIEGLRSETVR
ncbi:MAG TPA: hypothetical protein VFG63_10925 [Nocardioidaceae bacterium]|nr:hypothetical protein [Nocardioidaceae bacterium]